MEYFILTPTPQADVQTKQLGTAYYPEHWPESRWATDAALLREAGVTIVRMLEFAWDKLEPSEGQYDFTWIDRALSVFQAAGISVMLSTPTATPPPWLFAKHPEICRVDDRTTLRAVPGSRRSVCANVPAYREHTTNIVTALADHFGNHPNVIGWQLDNEFGCHNTVRCICDDCHAAFQRWLRAKYQTLDALNAAWGTQFWSATYTAWEQIPTIGLSTTQHNPGLLLDYRRFSSDSWVGYQKLQIEALRPKIGTRFITHNFMIRFFDLDYYKLAADLDFVSYDNYPHGMSGPSETAFNFDIMRGLKDKNFWVVEQQPGPVNWTPYNPPVPPGQVRAWTHQAFIHGADSVMYFRERAVNIGQEQYHAGMLKHDGTPDRCWFESKLVMEDLVQYPRLTRKQAPIAIIFDYDDLWTLEIDPHNRDFSYYKQALEIYRMFWDLNIPVDIRPRDADLTGYEAVFVPSPAVINPNHVANWRTYTEHGGKLVVLHRAFFKEQGNIWTDQPMPAGDLSALLGMTVDDFFSIPSTPAVGSNRAPNEDVDDWNDDRGSFVNDLSSRGGMGFGENFGLNAKTRYKLWAEILMSTTANTILRYGDGFYKDSVAATMNRVGQGEAYYLGCWCSPILPQVVWKALNLERLAIKSEQRNAVIEIARLQDPAGNSVEVAINHTKRTVSFEQPAAVETSK